MLIDPYRFAASFEDPFWTDVVLLLQVEDGALEERSGVPTSLTVVGAGVVNSAQALFGTESFDNPGTSSQGSNYIRAVGGPTTYLFDGPFTFEGFFFVDSYVNVINDFFSNATQFNSAGYFQCYVSDPAFNSWFGINANSDGGANRQSTSPVGSSVGKTGQWLHIAFTRDASNVFRTFVGGVKFSETTGFDITVGHAGVTTIFDVGKGNSSLSNNGDLNGHFEEIRITKACRYTADFTPPTEPFPVG